MSREEKEISPWRVAVAFGVMVVFDFGAPSLPESHHLLYGLIAFTVEVLICAVLLGTARSDVD